MKKSSAIISSLLTPWTKHVFITLFTGMILFALTMIGMGEYLSSPANRVIGSAPANFHAKTVEFENPAKGFIRGWLAPGQKGMGALLLLHGVRSDRTQMLARARFLNQAGYATLLIDLPAHGESSGERITFGAHESAGVKASVKFLRQTFPEERMGVVGVSLGAAATVLAHLDPTPDAIVLESMYPTIEEAISNRLSIHLGKAGASLAPILLWQLPLYTNVSAAELRPIQNLKNLGAPVLIISGSEDQHTTWPETERLFEAAAPPKELWKVEGAAHIDLHAFSPKEYERKVLQFLTSNLRNEIQTNRNDKEY